MTRMTMLVPAFLAAALLALGGCGGGGGGGGSAPNPDRDGDGIPNVSDAFPDDATRFADFTTVMLDRLAGGQFGAAVAVSGSDLVVGLSDDSSGVFKGVRWQVTGTAAGAPAQLNPLAGNGYSAAYGVGEDGAAVGESASGSDFVAVLWPAGSATPAELSLTGFSPPAAAYGISAGRVIGEATVAGNTVAVLWSSAAADPVPLGTLGGDTSAAYAISGPMIVGESATAAGPGNGVVWFLDATGAPGAPIALPPLDGDVASVALAINLGGEIVGESESAAGEMHAVLWTLDGAGIPGPPVDLGAGSASAINASSRIAGGSGAPGEAAAWDSRNTSLANAVLSGSFSFSRAFGMNEGNLLVGLAGTQGFVAVPK